MTEDGWIFVRTVKEFGSWRPQGKGSPNTLEEYTVTPAGTWVPEIDWSWLKLFRKSCPCKPGARPIQIVCRINPTEDQVKLKPDRTPRLREKEMSVFGLKKVEGV